MPGILGSPWADRLRGTDGSDTIYALGGNDVIFGSGGPDYIDGGIGIDTVDYSDSFGVWVDLAAGQGTWGDADGDIFVSIENVIGSAFDDRITGDGGNNVLTGLQGDDILRGGAGFDRLLGGDDDDSLLGGSGADVIDGGAGNDWANYFGSSAGVFISLYNDVAGGGDAEGDQLDGIENASGSFYDDDLWGDDGANQLGGGTGGNDTLKGFGGADVLAGLYGDDDLFGMDGDDQLHGQEGNDMLDGGAGTDRLQGYTGADTFVWNSTSDTGVTVPTMDVIWDFNFAQGDRIDLSAIDADVYAAGNQSFDFIGATAFSGTPGEINYYHSGNTTIIQLQTGTSPDVEGAIVLQGLHTPDDTWFVL
jgi:Ca2+-binding RTX toxin-like protein